MLRTNKWSPDTCKCQITYQWDTDEPPATRTFTPIAISPCSIHIDDVEDIPDEQLMTRIARRWNKVIEENRRKNKAITYLENNYPSAVIVSWGFNQSRVFEITLSGITNLQKNQIQNAADNFAGVGKVMVIRQ